MIENEPGEQTDPGMRKKVEPETPEQGIKIETLAQALERGRGYMEALVAERNEIRSPYRETLEERAEKLEQIETLRELQGQVEDLRALLLARTGPNPTAEQIEWAQGEAREGLLKLAHGARAFTRHHRVPPFRVGGAMLALRAISVEDGNPYAIAFAANTKVDEKHEATPDGKKWCAEQYLADLITEPTKPSEVGIHKVLTLAVVGEPRADDVSGMLHDTLTPCAECRERLVYDPKLTGEADIISLQTEIVTQSSDDFELQRVDSVKDIFTLHGGEL